MNAALCPYWKLESMKISRVGSLANHGRSQINLKDPKVSWNKTENSIDLRSTYVSDFSTESKHDYTVQIDLELIASMIRLLGDKLPNEIPEILSTKLSPVLREIIRLQKTCIGSIEEDEKLASKV